METIVNLAKVIESEKARIISLQEQYSKEISELPKGHIIPNGKYYHLHVYCAETQKTSTKYVGNGKEVFLLSKQIERRKHLEKQLREIKKELITIDKMLKHANKHIEPKITEPTPKSQGNHQPLIR
jgi:hypothetical protein